MNFKPAKLKVIISLIVPILFILYGAFVMRMGPTGEGNMASYTPNGPPISFMQWFFIVAKQNFLIWVPLLILIYAIWSLIQKSKHP